jgi:hypothetical protein
MKIVSFGPLSFQRPYIPKYVYFKDGSRVSELDDSSDESTEVLKTPIDLSDDLWIAIMEDGSVETFPRGKSKDWAVKKASEMISSIMEPTGDPIGRIKIIQQAASLIGISIDELMTAISFFKGDSLLEAFTRMQEKGGKIPAR